MFDDETPLSERLTSETADGSTTLTIRHGSTLQAIGWAILFVGCLGIGARRFYAQLSTPHLASYEVYTMIAWLVLQGFALYMLVMKTIAYEVVILKDGQMRTGLRLGKRALLLERTYEIAAIKNLRLKEMIRGRKKQVWLAVFDYDRKEKRLRIRSEVKEDAQFLLYSLQPLLDNSPSKAH